MPDPTNFETRLADAMRRYAERAPTDVDATALAREIATGQTEKRPQRPHWWPFGPERAAIDTPPRRSHIMSITAGVATIAIVALGATYAFVGLPDESTTQQPAAIGPDIVGDDWSFFSGTIKFDGTPSPPIDLSNTTTQSGLIIKDGVGWAGQTLTTTDPRMTGTRNSLDTIFTNLAGGTVSLNGSIWVSATTIDAEMGSWSCRLEGVEVQEQSSEAGWCTGEGGLEGLRAYIAITGAEGAYDTVPVLGYITNGDGPPAPQVE